MDEIRNDVNMMMRTLGMKIHATPLLRFRETMLQMRREGKVGNPRLCTLRTRHFCLIG